MIEGDRLFGEYCDALNADLLALGSQLRVRCKEPSDGDTLSLVDANGLILGDIPDTVDAEAIAAFEKIFAQHIASGGMRDLNIAR